MILKGYIIKDKCPDTDNTAYWNGDTGCYHEDIREAEVFWSWKGLMEEIYQTNEILEVKMEVNFDNTFKMVQRKPNVLPIYQKEIINEPVLKLSNGE